MNFICLHIKIPIKTLFFFYLILQIHFCLYIYKLYLLLFAFILKSPASTIWEGRSGLYTL